MTHHRGMIDKIEIYGDFQEKAKGGAKMQSAEMMFQPIAKKRFMRPAGPHCLRRPGFHPV